MGSKRGEKEANTVQSVLNLTLALELNVSLHSYKFPHRLTYLVKPGRGFFDSEQLQLTLAGKIYP
jgi:hypothetical protein